MKRLVTAAALLVVVAFAGTPVTAAPDSRVPEGSAVAVFAGGCFWCMEPPFDEIEGVLSTTSGYIGGTTPNPTYKQVSAGGTGHTEAVRIVYDPRQVTYAALLDVFWRNIDPLTANRQFCDSGSQYRSAIFYATEQERQLAESTKRRVAERFRAPVATEVVAISRFYPAEEYHQDYYRKNPLRYKYYRRSCGRDHRLEALWGKPVR